MRTGVDSPVIDAAARLLAPFMWLFAIYVLVHGHDSPGGGFQGGVIMAASIILLRFVRGRERVSAFTSNHALTLGCAGPLLYGGIGGASLLFGGNFLDYGALPLPLDPAEVRVIGTLGIETGVMLGVTGVLVLIFDMLVSWDDADEEPRSAGDRESEIWE